MVSDSKDISYTFWGQNKVKAIKNSLQCKELIAYWSIPILSSQAACS